MFHEWERNGHVCVIDYRHGPEALTLKMTFSFRTRRTKPNTI
jgi:hypothetical protein